MRKRIERARLRTGLALLLFAITPLLSSQNAAESIRISLAPEDKIKYLHFMEGRNIEDRISYTSPDLDSSPVIDMILINKALTLGGLSYTVSIVEVPNTERERAMVLEGIIDITGTSEWGWWADENEGAVYKSDVIVPDGFFEKGLYTTKDKAATLSITTVKDLSVYTCVSNENWKVDWKTLSVLGFKSLQSAPTIDAMFRMVTVGRADLTVQSFSGLPDLSITSGLVTLYPIRGWKVLLSGSRHYVVSKASPHGALIFAALQKGIALMRKSGEIDRALREAGFINQGVRDWKELQAPQP